MISLVAVTVFVVTRLATDPARGMLPVGATQEQYTNLKRSLGLDASIPAQFVDYVQTLLSGTSGRRTGSRRRSAT